MVTMVSESMMAHAELDMMLNMEKIRPTAVAFGDWHANQRYAIQALDIADKKVDKGVPFIHVGDFGFYSTALFKYDLDDNTIDEFYAGIEGASIAEQQEAYANGPVLNKSNHVVAVNDHLRKLGRILYVVAGNHEDYWELDESLLFGGFYREDGGIAVLGNLPPEGYVNENTGTTAHYDEEGFIVSEMFSNIRLVPRTHEWVWNDRRFVSVGGANSIDKFVRLDIKAGWWEEEQITDEQVESVLSCDSPDYLICHDAPYSVARTMYGRGNSGFGVYAEAYSEESQKQLDRVVDKLSPSVLVCGHHHVRRNDYVYTSGTKVIILDRDGKPFDDNMVVMA